MSKNSVFYSPYFLKAVLLTVSILGSIVAIELFLHIFKYQDRPLLVEPNKAFLFRMSPHDSELIYRQHYQLNNRVDAKVDPEESLHFRPDFRENKDTNERTFTVLMIGDSFTFGHGVNDLDTYPSKVEEILNTQGYDVNVYNAGISGYGTDQEYLYIKRITKIIQPSMIIINLHENDVYDNNDNCLFKKNESGEFKQVSGLTSNIYIQSVIAKYTPLPVKKGKIFNLILFSFSRENLRRNYLCTNQSIDKQAMVKKMNFLLQQLKQELLQETHLLLTIVPTESYLDKSFPSDHFLLSDRKLLISQLSSFQLLDAGEEIAQTIDSSLIKKIFNNDEVEPNAKPGTFHLNNLGNLLFAEYISKEIISQYDLPKYR